LQREPANMLCPPVTVAASTNS